VKIIGDTVVEIVDTANQLIRRIECATAMKVIVSDYQRKTNKLKK
jgi:hypothetical protein